MTREVEPIDLFAVRAVIALRAAGFTGIAVQQAVLTVGKLIVLARLRTAAQLLDPLLMPMDSPASDYQLVNIPETSAVYFKNGNPVRTTGAPLQGLVRVTEGEDGKFLGMGEIDDEGRVAPRRLVVEYPA